MRVNFLIISLFVLYGELSFGQTNDDEYVEITIPETVSAQYDGVYKIDSGETFESIIGSWAAQGGYKPYLKLGNFGGVKNLIVPIDVVFFDGIVDSLDSFIDKINTFDLLASENIFLHVCLYKSKTNPTLLIQVNSNVCR
jgi:hypothetical protein